MKRMFTLMAGCIFFNGLIAQESEKKIDSTSIHKTMPNVQLFTNEKGIVSFMPEVSGMMIMAGKKNALVNIELSGGNKSSNNMRELLSRVPGIHLWESDAGGVQPGIANRGLSPNRSWEFNVRQDGFDIAADPFGYPEAYYQPPATAIHEIEIARGTAALQYGPQFGGLINYRLKNSNRLKIPFDVELEQSYSTAGLFNSFVGMGFKQRRGNGYVFVNHKSGTGWRENTKLNNNTIHGDFTYRLSSSITIAPAVTYFQLLSQQPGGLTDSAFLLSPQASWRSRNWMGIDWFIPAITINYQHDSSMTWENKIAGIISNRNSVSFNQPINKLDTIDRSTGRYANRTLQLDSYENIQFESRVKKVFGIGDHSKVLMVGMRYFKGYTNRLGDGLGTAGTGYELQVQSPFNRDIDFHSENWAVFTENVIRINNRWLLTFGARWEKIKAAAAGRYLYVGGVPVMLLPQQKIRQFLLLGSGFEYHLSKSQEIYGSVTQCYRPVLFSYLVAPPGNDVIDSALQDSKGYVMELGCRSKWKKGITYDVSAYYMRYAGKIGSITQSQSGMTSRLLTNIGDSYSAGLEGLVEWKMKRKIKNKIFEYGVFISYAYNHSRYYQSIKDPSFSGNWVENAPRHILRSGMDCSVEKWTMGYQFSYTDKCYSDAQNSVVPTVNGQTGIIPSYALMDFYVAYDFGNSMKLKLGCNNLTGRKYFTRRTGGLPGPGVLPGEGTVVNFTFIKSWK